MTMQRTRTQARPAGHGGDEVAARLGRVLVLVLTPAVAAGALLLGVALALRSLLG